MWILAISLGVGLGVTVRRIHQQWKICDKTFFSDMIKLKEVLKFVKKKDLKKVLKKDICWCKTVRADVKQELVPVGILYKTFYQRSVLKT